MCRSAASLLAKFQILTMLAAVISHFCTDKGEIWRGERVKFWCNTQNFIHRIEIGSYIKEIIRVKVN